ncbi:bifunctional glutamate N-acetyltransferase/amino-acid acetyltransferase ArgJ [Saccharospirillum mangrovi]|uniref:bifunctional glutamate N-acetyltransferase/amino-acid acetyltransferase ArgJ n=1 Tax=Saccharospirillum mangrovi TaxID=2161747 RepID=UPI000D38B960|nr:bifunctional glutamate N-acetyltransferase/amino-acid acetyltransferase ArgJ [Saccharospirillum mangrovi]
MAVGEGLTGVLLPIAGVDIGVAQAGIKRVGRTDLVVFRLADGARTAGVFTTNAFCAAPVQVAKAHLQSQPPQLWLINTGNANAGTGARGLKDANDSCQELGRLTDLPSESVLPFSTGVIGEYLPMDRLLAGLPNALDDLKADNWQAAARGIMTTDTRPKGLSCEIELDGERIRITGIAKGSGMIKPNMATMLSFVATDAKVAPALLDSLLRDAVNASFNRITVDSDTSTNDACMLVATGQAAVSEIDSPQHPSYDAFRDALIDVMRGLAHEIVRDGEGATKFIEIAVEQAASTDEALAVAYTIAHSPLVKTALTASDANWGRILAAVGRSGLADLDVDKVDIWLDDIQIVAQGERAADYTEAAGSAVMRQEELTIRVVLNRGPVADRVWTTDLSYEYIRINAEYRT